ncbi:class I SAM-dependent methyltransferase [Hydrogenophaga sp. ZJX-1]|uniref:class I SAM-dependent methyltransferase n=1 Tax=Hydrogenophaga sp. ZJX-1 TaxID=3404778 RepID=UPI003B27E67A
MKSDTPSDIHPDDDMFSGSLDHYESVGKEMADLVEVAAHDLGLSAPHILELPCGYGRVTRHLVKLFPAERILACDIMVPAVEFVATKFGVKGHPAEIPVNELTGIETDTFDIAVMGSLITHLSAANSHTLLQNFSRVMKSGGIAIITTHGIRSRQLLGEKDVYQVGEEARQHLVQQYDNSRFGFVNYLPDHSFEAKTVDYIGDSYGISLIPDQWMTEISQTLGLNIIKKIVGGWDNHQDVFFLQKQ